MAGIDRIRRKLAESIEIGVASTPVDVLVMGPNLEERSLAAVLRRRIIQEANSYGTNIRPEHEELISVASKRLGAGHHLTAYEMHLVEVSHLVVMIPASPGSFCELGLFSSYRCASEKMLILVSDQFRGSRSYVADGPLTAAKQNGAQVTHVDYGDPDSACKFVKTRVEEVRTDLIMKSLRQGAD